MLEIGGGTGRNLPYYGPTVESLTVTEPEPPMLRRLERRVREHAPLTNVLRAPGRRPPVRGRHASTSRCPRWCSAGSSDQPRALRELRRVLRPGGQLLFIEHVRSDDARLARRQDRMNG